MYGIVSLPAKVVEPMIALSIVYVAIENLIVGELKPWRLALVWAVALTLTLPHIGLLWDFNRSSLGRFVAQEQPECAAPWRSGLQTWHRCQHRLLWEHRPMPLYTVKGVGTAGGAATAVVVALGLLGCAVLLRGDLVPAQQRPVSRPT